MKVSILVVCYNQEDLIEECLLSCLNQDYEKLEVIVSDDCSTDSTPQILKKFQSEYPRRLKVFFNDKNLGITANSNKALAECTGDLIAICNGDDFYYDSKISTQVKYFTDDPQLSFCYHYCHILEGCNIVGISGNRRKDYIRGSYDMIKKTGAHIAPASVMVRSASIPDEGFNTKLLHASDWLFYIEVAMKGRVRRIDKVLSVYRYHAGNIGKRYLTYMDDFTKTESILCSRYNTSKVRHAANKGLKRMMFGNMYRAKINKDEQLLSRSLNELRCRLPFLSFYFIRALVSFRFTSTLFRKCKPLIKIFF